MMTEQEKKLYELALREGKRRFGSECKHIKGRGNRCVKCFRRVV